MVRSFDKKNEWIIPLKGLIKLLKAPFNYPPIMILGQVGELVTSVKTRSNEFSGVVNYVEAEVRLLAVFIDIKFQPVLGF